MADEQPDRDAPSLELPSLFKRRRTTKQPRPTPVEDVEAPEAGGPPQPSPVELVETPEAGGPPQPSPVEPVEPHGRHLPALLAATVVGAVVGLLSVGLVWLALGGCSGLRGTSSCGDAGFLVLLAIFVAMVVAGRVLLTALGVRDATSTALLGMALVAVVALLFVDDLDSALGAALLAAVAAGAFALAQWVASSNTEPGDRPR
jgi:hypothetical protein